MLALVCWEKLLAPPSPAVRDTVSWLGFSAKGHWIGKQWPERMSLNIHWTGPDHKTLGLFLSHSCKAIPSWRYGRLREVSSARGLELCASRFNRAPHLPFRSKPRSPAFPPTRGCLIRLARSPACTPPEENRSHCWESLRLGPLTSAPGEGDEGAAGDSSVSSLIRALWDPADQSGRVFP